MKARIEVQRGFTLVEIAIVLLIVTILLGYTVAMFPRQQELKQYRAADAEMDRIVDAIIGFAQVNGRLPCPALPATQGLAFGGGGANCVEYGGFVPINTLGITGRVNQDSLMLDPWGNPYRYYVTNADFDPPGATPPNGQSDFVWGQGELRTVGIVDSDGDGFPDLNGQFIICDDNGTSIDDQCTGANQVFGNYQAGPPVVYNGAPFVLLSMGKNWADTPVNDELENRGSSRTTADLGIPAGPSGDNYFIKDVNGPPPQTTFVRRPTGFADDFDDIVRWVSPNVLYSRLIEADQLP